MRNGKYVFQDGIIEYYKNGNINWKLPTVNNLYHGTLQYWNNYGTRTELLQYKKDEFQGLYFSFKYNPIELKKFQLISELNKLSDEDRHDVISCYCKFCGSKDTGCHCWNDE